MGINVKIIFFRADLFSPAENESLLIMQYRKCCISCRSTARILPKLSAYASFLSSSDKVIFLMMDMGLVAAGTCVNGAWTEAGYSMLMCGCKKREKKVKC